jgi:hypothetical protein
MITTGRYGEVKYAPDGLTATLAAILSLNVWKLSQKTDKVNVTCFGDANKKYVMGMKDISGTVGGFWNSDETTLFEAVDAAAPGLLELVPNKLDVVGTAPGVVPAWSGLAYLDVDIDTNVEGAPAVSGSFVAAGDWALNLIGGSLLKKAA